MVGAGRGYMRVRQWGQPGGCTCREQTPGMMDKCFIPWCKETALQAGTKLSASSVQTTATKPDDQEFVTVKSL